MVLGSVSLSRDYQESSERHEAAKAAGEGFDVVHLIDKCWPGRLDLDYEDDIAFIEQERGSTSIKRRHVERLLRCCRKPGVNGP